jgi:hypothetical protein
MQSQNGQGNYTGERLARERPQVYGQIIELIAQGVSLNRIARQCGVSRHTIRAVREHEAIPIAQRKQEILGTAVRVATASIHRIEDELAAGKIKGTQLVPVFGVSVDKLVALSNDPMQIQVSHTIDPGPNLYAKLDSLAQRLAPKPRTIDAHAEPPAALPALPNGETISDSGAENGLNARGQAGKKES